jgi:hypothetical protein
MLRGHSASFELPPTASLQHGELRAARARVLRSSLTQPQPLCAAANGV